MGCSSFEGASSSQCAFNRGFITSRPFKASDLIARETRALRQNCRALTAEPGKQVAMSDRKIQQAKEQPEQRPEESSVDTYPVEMGSGAAFYLNPNLIIGKLAQILLDGLRNLAAARIHRMFDEHVHQLVR